MKNRAQLGQLLTGLLFASTSSVALAQAQSSAAPAPQTSAANTSQNAGLQDIIVTARRRDESLAKTPVAVSVVTADAIVKAHVTVESDLRFATPGLQISSGESSNTINFAIRGQSQDPSSDTRPGVLPYFNEVPIAGQTFSTGFYDLQSVQVLKGPQGTLFGRSATGGAVLFTTQKPTDKFEGYVSGLAGNYAAKEFQGAVNVPVVKDILLVRVAGFYSDRDGMQHNYLDGSRVGDLKRWGVRGSATLNLDRFHNTLVFDHFHANGQNTAPVLSGLLPLNPAGGPPYFPGALLYSGTSTSTATLTGECTLQGIAQFPGACPPVNSAVAAFYANYFSDPAHPSVGLTGLLAEQQARGPYSPYYNGQNLFRANINKFTNTTSYELNNNLTIKNIFGYFDTKVLATDDVEATPYGLQDTVFGPQNKIRQYTDEIQLQGQVGRLTFTTGFFYSNEKVDYRFRGNFFDLIFGGQPGAYHHILTSETYAGYAQGNYKLNDSGLSITGGLRYTSERVGKLLPLDDGNGAAFCTTPTPGYSCDQHKSFKNLNYTAGIQDQISSQMLIYAKTSQAFKNGGYNGDAPPKVGSGSVGGDGYGAQRTRDVEVGSKFRGDLGSVPFTLNAAAYYSWTKNDQRPAYVLNPNPGALNINVPTAHIYGFELDGQVLPTSWLRLGGTFSYTHAQYTNGNVVVSTVFGPVAEVYDRFPETPKTSGTVYAEVSAPVTSHLNLLVHGDVYAQSQAFTTPRSTNYAGTTIPSYALVNFRLGVTDEDGGWSLTANVKNAFNKVYYTGGFALGEIYQINTLVPGDRRTFTVELRYKF